ncbi:hypothetical protein vseg_004289 [Gypsophila vaccaria]
MPRLLLSTKTKKINMIQCRKHPKHKQCPGVCSLCLAEKLSRVSSLSATIIGNSSRDRYTVSRARAKYYYYSSSSFSSSEDESSYPSSSASPTMQNEKIINNNNNNNRLRSNFSDVNNIMKIFGKSKSMSCGEKEEKNNDDNNNNIKKKNIGGFWLKFLHIRRNNDYGKHVINKIDYNNDEAENTNQVYMSQPLVPNSRSMLVC